ncbi:hypothetical protein ACJBX5_02115 [Streptococcus suis]|uniref:Uncharacterized protein n=1 Tax=Streptococcus suis TaxID=1307 RepID=A0A116MJE4_STRSU|nr:hypothetical protein [Streptococcus suis]MBL6515355.1 hypothetical protein [Streptococcus suis]MDW8710391.1 hypothetical protein [Streptococcus suis]NQG84774.1 hypothetical protein [Streptococcus suis]NQM18182.1 hypothetical protein [Streptococcus suis]CYV51004.1 Uncharacterised protein [Streptococcus suis]
MIFSIEALYTLHLLNDHSDDLSFLPLPNGQNLDRKSLLKETLEKGFEDLKELQLVVDNQLTERGVEYGYYLEEYHSSPYHCRVDLSYFCAPAVDEFKRYSILIKEVDEGLFVIERLASVWFLGFLLETHPILHHLDDKMKDYLMYDWTPKSHFSLLVEHGRSEGLRLAVEQLGTIYSDTLFLEIEESIYEYDLTRELMRSIDSETLQSRLIKDLKVEV